MLPFQKTHLYKKFLGEMDKFLKAFKKNKNATLRDKVEEEVLNLSGNIAKGLNREDEDEQRSFFNLAGENIYSILALIDIAEKTYDMEKAEAEALTTIIQQVRKDLANFRKAQKRIIILSAIYGQGHMSAAKAIKQGLEELYGYDYHIEIVDFFGILSAAFNRTGLKFYEGATKHMPSFYRLFFEGTDTKWQVKLLNLINYPFSAAKLTKFFKEKNPDLIISTFPIWDYIAMQIWKKHKPEAKFISIVTDSISIHSVWATAETDYHIVANEDTAISLKKLGVKNDKIEILGFPVRLDFLEKTNRESFLSQYGLDPGKYTILFLPTATNINKTIKTLKELIEEPMDYNLVVVAGRNTQLKPKLEKFAGHPNLRIFGWTDQLPDFLKSCDLVITKAGGATVMECIAAQKPMVLIHIIPGQEMGNAEFIRLHHLGIIPDSINMTIRESISYIRQNQSTFLNNLKKVSNPYAALHVAKFIHSVIENPNQAINVINSAQDVVKHK